MKRVLPSLIACLIASMALGPLGGRSFAQTRQPAQITTTPTATPQTFDVLDKTGAWVPLVVGNQITLQSFGAKCDGSDDTVPIQNWLASAHARSKLVGMPGNCAFKTPLVIPAVDDLIVDFQGGLLRYQGTNTNVDILSMGARQSDCAAHRVLIQNVRMVSDTVMTGGAGFKEMLICNLRVDHAYFGNFWDVSRNLYNGCHFWGGNQVYVTDYSCRGSNIGEIDNGEDVAAGGFQMTDAFHYNGVVSGNTIGLNIAGNCGGCQWDAFDAVNNKLNVLIDQSQTPGIHNVQIVFGPLFASDGTSGAPNNGIQISDPGTGPTSLCQTATPPMGMCSELFCKNCWLSTSANDCLVIDAGVNWEIDLEGARIRNCGAHGINNASSNIHMVIDGGIIANNGYGLLNTATHPWIQILGPPSVFHIGSGQKDFVGLTPTVVSGCGGSDASFVDQSTDYEFSMLWGSTAGQTTCVISFAAYHFSRPTHVSGQFRNPALTLGIAPNTISTTGESFFFSAAVPVGAGVSFSNSGLGF